MWPRRWALVPAILVTLACANGAAGPTRSASSGDEDTTRGAESEPSPTEGDEPAQLTCFSGSVANGICETFHANTEPLGLVAAHCQRSGGVSSREPCPTEGRVGACAHDGHEDVYYGTVTTPDQLRAACVREGGSYAP